MADLKERIAKRCAKHFEDGDFINLGIGLPTMVADYLPEDVIITCHSENGFAGIDVLADADTLDVNIINSGGQYVTALPRAKFFDTAESFGLVRGGHVKATVLGAMEVAENGDIANWIVPGKSVPGMGGAMDLVVGAKKVIVAMQHTQKGAPKLFEKISLPATALKAVDMIVTEMGVIEITDRGFELRELAPGVTVDDIKAATAAPIIVEGEIKEMCMPESSR